MTLSELLRPQQSCVKLNVTSKSAFIQEAVRRASVALNIAAPSIAAALTRREELGSTGLGEGIAIPHARLAEVQRPTGFLYTLKHPIDFDAIDGKPVDLVFVLLLPTSFHAEHLNALALIARRFRDAATSRRVRGAKHAADLHAAFVEHAE